MVPYIASFTTAFILAWISEKERHIKNTKRLAQVLLVFSAVVLSALAAMRADSIGTDVQTYVIRFFNGARGYSSFIKYLSFFPLDYVEPGYKLFNYVISRFTDDIKVLHFCIALFDLSFVLTYLWENRKKMSVSLGLLVFMLMLYNVGFNAVRQTMAVCVCLYAFNSARDRKLKKFLLLILIAGMFHRSAVVMAITYPLVAIFEKRKIKESNRLIGIIAVISVVVLLFDNSIVGVLIRVGIFPVKFSHYIGNSFSLSRMSAFIFLIPVIVVFKIYENKYYEIDRFNMVLLLYVILWPILAQLDSVSDQFGRMAYFFSVANIGIYAQIPIVQKRVRNKSNTRIVSYMIILFLIGYWILNFYVWKVGSTVPYLFSEG